MSAVKVPHPVYDPVLRRHRGQCPECPWEAVRSKAEPARHALAQHLIYHHGREVAR